MPENNFTVLHFERINNQLEDLNKNREFNSRHRQKITKSIQEPKLMKESVTERKNLNHGEQIHQIMMLKKNQTTILEMER